MVLLGGLEPLVQLRGPGGGRAALRLLVPCCLWTPSDPSAADRSAPGPCGSLRRSAWITGTCCVCTPPAASIRGGW